MQNFYSCLTGRLVAFIKIMMVVVVMVMGSEINAQTLLQWNTFGNAGTETTEPSIFNDANISSSLLTLGTINPALNGNRLGGSDWFDIGDTNPTTLAESFTGNDYIQFIVTPNSGFSFTATSLVFSWDRSSTGPSSLTLRSSNDGFVSDLGTIAGLAANITSGNTITISGLTNIPAATTFRLYGYAATATGGTGGFDIASNIVNVQLYGTTTAAFTSAQSGDWNTTTTWVGGVIPTAGSTVNIVSNHVVTLGAALTNTGIINIGSSASLATASSITNSGTVNVNGTFQVNGGGYASGNALVYAATGSTLVMNNNPGLYGISTGQAFWPTTNPPFNVTIQGSGAEIFNTVGTVGGLLNITSTLHCTTTNALTVNGTVNINTGALLSCNNTSSFTLGATGTALANSEFKIGVPLGATMNGILQINPNGFINTNGPVYGAASVLKYNTNSTYGRGLEWTVASGTIGTSPGYPNDITLSNNTTLNIPNTGAAAYGNSLGMARDLSVENGSSFYMDFGGGGNKSGSMLVGRNILVAGNVSLGNAIGGDLFVGGNWIYTSGTFSPNNRLVSFNGTTAQTLSGATTFSFLTLNNPTGLTLVSGDVTVTQTLGLTSGKITLGANNMVIGATGTITPFSATNYIVTNLSGTLKRSNVTTTALDFPVGLTYYNPLTINNTGIATDIAVKVIKPPTIPASVPTKIVNLEWSVTPSNAGANTNITFNWNVADQAGAYNASGTGEIGNYTTGPNYVTTDLVSMSGQSKLVNDVALATGSNKLVLGNRYAVYSLTPPVLNAAVGATVDNPFTVTFTDNAAWRTAITSITVNGTLLSVTAYSISAGQIIFNPSANALIQSSGIKTIVVFATAYLDATVSQPLNPGVPSSLSMAVQPLGPTANSGTLATPPQVQVRDQYGNAVLAGITLNAVVTTGQAAFWTLGGTVNITTNASGIAVFTNLTATNLTSSNYNAAAITFTPTTGSGSIISNAFIIVAGTLANDYFRSNSSNTGTGGSWATVSNWESSNDNVTWIPATQAPTSSANTIIIQSGHNIDISTGTQTADQLTIAAGATLRFSGGTFTLANGAGVDLIVNGTFNVITTGTFTQSGQISFNAGSLYVHNRNGGAIPTATWNVTSTCSILGMTTITPTNYGQSFGNFTWNCAGQGASNYINIESNLFATQGTLTVGPSTANYFSFGNTAGTYTNTINSLVISGGVFNVIGNAGTENLTVTNDVVISGGSMNIEFGGGSGNINIGRDLAISGLGSVTGILNGSTFSPNINIGRDLISSGSSTTQINLENTSSTGACVFKVARDFITSATSSRIVDFGTGTITGNSIEIGRNFSKSGTGSFYTTSTTAAIGFVFTGGTLASPATFSYTGTTSSYTSYVISTTAVVQLLTPLTLGAGTGPISSFTVTGTLNFQTFNVIAGNTTDPAFLTSTNATLITSNTNGIGGNTALGSVSSFGSVSSNSVAGRAQFAAGVSYVFNAPTVVPFPIATTGSVGNPSNITINANVTSNQAGTLIVTGIFSVNSPATYTMNANTLSLNNGSLTIASGATFDNAGENQIQSGGGSPSISITGRFITRDIQGFTGTNTSIPGIVPTLNAGCTIEYAFAGNQSVSIRSDYKNINIVNGGIKTLVANSPVTPIAGTVTVADATTLDVANNSFGDAATNLTLLLTGKFINGGANVKPDIGGTYTLGVGSTIDFSGNSATTIRQAPTYYNIIISGSNVENSSTINGIKFQAGGSFTVKSGGTFKTLSPAGFSNTIGSVSTAISNVAPSNPIITLEPNSIIDYSGAAQTITTASISSPTTGNYYNLQLSGSGIKTAPATLTILGDLSRAGTHTFNANNGNVIFAGTGAQKYFVVATNTPPAIDFYNFTNSNTVGLTIDSTLGVLNELRLNPSSKLTLGIGDINLRSTPTQTAIVPNLGTANLPTIAYNTGRFNIERYLPARSSWRLLATPIDIGTSTSIRQMWQENGTATVGYGTQVSGPAGGIGLDYTTQRGSLKYFDVGTQNYIEITNTTAAQARKEGYYVFVRGDRTTALVPASNAISTTMRTKGRINIGTQAAVPIPPVSFISWGNPYPCAIDFRSINRTSSADAFIAWDPQSAGGYNVGAFVTYAKDLNDGHYKRVPFVPLSTANIRDTIMSGEAVFLQNNVSTAGSITLNEIDKVLGGGRNVSRFSEQSRGGVTIPSLEINLQAINTDGSSFLADGVLMNFDNSYSNSVDNLDIRKIANTADNLAIQKTNSKLIVERRQTLQATDTIFLSLTNTRIAPYRFEIDPSVLGNLPLTAYLNDKFLGTETPVSLTDVTNVNFSITSDAASRLADRFMIVFRPSGVGGPLPVNFVTITGEKNTDKTNTVKWSVANEINITGYTIERSTNVSLFTAIGNNAAAANNGNSAAYNFIDATPAKATNYYRVKAISSNGQVQYSSIVKVVESAVKPLFAVTPNPVENKTVRMNFENMEGVYRVTLLSKQGASVYTTSLNVSSAREVKKLALGSDVAAGVYELRLMNKEGKSFTQTVFIQ